jgi:imidazolonepropionase
VEPRPAQALGGPVSAEENTVWDSIWTNAHLATMRPGGAPYGAVRDGAVAVKDGIVAWLGSRKDLPGAPESLAAKVHDARGGWLAPGLIDCHTHLVYAGHRAHDFEKRLEGATYEEIAGEGGGILSTVAATRAASQEELLRAAKGRLKRLLLEGVTTVEIKSGYGLETSSELRMLRVARILGDQHPVTVRTSLLGAHALPPEYAHDREGYVGLVREEMIPAAAREGLADYVDAFCERIAFSVEECEDIFRGARAHDLPVRLHADQLSDSGGATLAARFEALSADHLEYCSSSGADALARSGTVAVLLPGAFYFLGQSTHPPVELFREKGVPLAIATDSNPGSSPVSSLLLTMNMACTLFGLTPEESLAGVTRNAAAALGLGGDRGVLEVGKRADFAVWDVDTPAELSYWVGGNPCVAVVQDGSPVGR